MSEQHTQGELCTAANYPHGKTSICTHTGTGWVEIGTAKTETDASRLVACWNACKGISTDALETEGSAVMGWTRTASKLIHATKQRDELQLLCAEWEKKAATWLASPEAAKRLDGYRDLAQQLNSATAQRDELLEALKLAHGALHQAAADLNGWGCYAPAHFQTKHRLADDVQAYVNAAESVRAAIAKAEGRAA